MNDEDEAGSTEVLIHKVRDFINLSILMKMWSF
jgi:hypothetical protein